LKTFATRLGNYSIKKVLVLFAVLFSSCVSSHYDQTENFLFSWKIGDLKTAAVEAEKLSESGPKKDRLLYKLEEGSTKRLSGDLEGSVRALGEASKEYERWFGVHLEADARVSDQVSSVLGSAEWKPYKSRVYERVMMRMYQALNYLQLEEKGRARAEIFKSRQAIEDARQIWSKELLAAQEEMNRKGINLNRGMNEKDGSSLQREISRIRSMIPPNLPNYLNPAAIYLEALYFLRGGTQREDFEKASFSLRRLAALFPENQWIREDLGEAMSFKIDSRPKTYVFYESGRAPVRVEKRFDLPVVFFATNARIPYLGLALPSLQTTGEILSPLRVGANGLEEPLSTSLLADMDAIIAKEFEKDYPLELSRAIAGSLAKGGLQYLATDAVRDEDDVTRAVVGIGAGLLAQVTTRTDLRAWATLPRRIEVCKLSTPADKKLTLSGGGATFRELVTLNDSTTNLVWVRRISSHTPIRVVGVLSLDP